MRISDLISDVYSSDLFPLRLVIIVVASVGPGGGQPWARRTGRMARTAEPARIVHDPGCARRARGGRPYQSEGRIPDQTARQSAARTACTSADRCLAHQSEDPTSALQSLMPNSYAVFCLNKKKPQTTQHQY